MQNAFVGTVHVHLYTNSTCRLCAHVHVADIRTGPSDDPTNDDSTDNPTSQDDDFNEGLPYCSLIEYNTITCMCTM